MAARGRRDADDRLAALLASGLPVVEAAAQAGVSERTAHRRLRDPTFVARVGELRGRFVADAVARLSAALTEAAGALQSLLGHADPNVRIRAAVEVLRNAVRLREHAELADRITQLERQLTERTS